MRDAAPQYDELICELANGLQITRSYLRLAQAAPGVQRAPEGIGLVYAEEELTRLESVLDRLRIRIAFLSLHPELSSLLHLTEPSVPTPQPAGSVVRLKPRE